MTAIEGRRNFVLANEMGWVLIEFTTDAHTILLRMSNVYGAGLAGGPLKLLLA
jgi:hypothetical protein